MEVYLIDLTSQAVNKNRLKSLALIVAKYLQLKGELSIVLCGQGRIRSLNKQWRNKDESTDVLSFKQINFNEKLILGEIFINLVDCRKGKKYFSFFNYIPNQQEVLVWLLIHGLLHLAGFKDDNEEEKDRMIKKGKNIFKKIEKEL